MADSMDCRWRCPYCNEFDADDHYFGEGSHEIYCGSCDKEYVVNVHVTHTYEAKVIDRG